MCEPVTLGIVGLLGTGLSAMGQMQQAGAAANAADYQAAVDQNNSILAQRAAEDARKRGEQAEEEQRRKTAVMEDRQRALAAASGVELGSGSILDVIGDTAQYGEIDARTIRNNAEREALGYEAQGMNFKASSALNNMKAASSRAAGPLTAGATFLSGASTVGSNWYKLK